MFSRMRQTLALVAVAALIVVAGCTKPEDKGAKDTKPKQPVAQKPKPKPGHEDWWCKEHGIPEEECSMCIDDEAVLRKMFKDKGDWCDKHKRAKSQCFICDASLWDKYKAQYKAKTGKEAPFPDENPPGGKAEPKKEEPKKEEPKKEEPKKEEPKSTP